MAGCGLVGYGPGSSSEQDGGPPAGADAAPEATAIGVMDPDFGTSGTVTFDYVDDDATSKDDRATAVAIDSQGRIVVAVSGTYVFYASDDQVDMAAISMRLLADGSFDSSYQYGALSSPGTTVNTDSVWSHANDLLIAGSDDVVLCGFREWGGTDDPTIYRYSGTDGQPSPTFGTGGVTNIVAAGEVQGTGCTVDPSDGNAVVVGSRGSAAMLVGKIYTTTGASFTPFGGGTVVYDNAGNEHGEDVVVDALGRIYVIGTDDSAGTQRDIVVWRFLNDASLDSSFGTGGIFRFDSSGNDDVAVAGALASDGDLLVTGSSLGLDDDMLVLKISAQTGQLVTSFADSGVFRFDSGVGRALDQGNAILPAGNAIWVTGRSSTADSTPMALWKLTADGALDTTFGGMDRSTIAGLFLAPSPTNGADERGWDLAVTGDGALIVVGEAMTASGFTDAAIWKVR